MFHFSAAPLLESELTIRRRVRKGHLLCVEVQIVDGVADVNEILVPADHCVVPPLLPLPHELPGLVSCLVMVVLRLVLQVMLCLDYQNLEDFKLRSGVNIKVKDEDGVQLTVTVQVQITVWVKVINSKLQKHLTSFKINLKAAQDCH